MNVTLKLIPTEEIVSVIPLLQILNNSIPAQTLHARLNEMVGQGTSVLECMPMTN